MSLPPIPTVEGASCPACGRAVAVDQTYCPYCGARLPAAAAPGAARVIGAILLGLVALIFGGISTCAGVFVVAGGLDGSAFLTLPLAVIGGLITFACVRGIRNLLRPRK